MSIRFGARLKRETSDETYEAIRNFLSKHAVSRVTYAYFDGVYSVYFEKREDIECLKERFPSEVALSEEIF